MEHTGERMIPEASYCVTFWEHLYRYRFAASYVLGKSVLDIACGEGYGTAALVRAGAASVLGMDVSESACTHARQKYGVDARVGDAEHIPLPDGSIDTVVSFETIEHIEHPEAFLDECTRVLVPGGKLVVSTPNRDVYSDGEAPNPFHQCEMNESEFSGLLGARFPHVQMFIQHPTRLDIRDWRTWAVPDLPRRPFRKLGRLHKALGRFFCRRVFCRHLAEGGEEQFRASPDTIILARDAPFAALFNPYGVKQRLPNSESAPHFLVAVARRA